MIKQEQFDTYDEYIFALWLEELKVAGYIKDWKHEPYEFKLSDGLKIQYQKVTELKTKTKIEDKEQTILQPSVYTPDFWIKWEEKSYGKLFQDISSNVKIVCPFISNSLYGKHYYSYVELKPSFDSGNMTRLFKNNQKFVYEKFKVYINLFIGLDDLFNKTFTPHEYTLTHKTKVPRKMKYIPKTLKEFLQ